MAQVRLYLILSLLLSFAGCEKKPYPLPVPISFLPSVTITPASRTMHRGDTLWLEANFSDLLLDNNSGHRYRVRPQDLPLHSAIVYKELLGIGQQPTGIAPAFRIVEKVGQASIDGSFTGSFKPVYDGHFYRARIGLIPTKACIASLSLLIGLDDTPRGFTVLPFIHLPPNAQGREQEAVLDDSFYVINDGRANNFDLYRQYYQAYSLGPDAPPKSIIYEQKSTFTVEVK